MGKLMTGRAMGVFAPQPVPTPLLEHLAGGLEHGGWICAGACMAMAARTARRRITRPIRTGGGC